jgi:hypothetical protein
MNNSSTRNNLIRTGRRKVNWDSRRGLNPQYLRIMGKYLI